MFFFALIVYTPGSPNYVIDYSSCDYQGRNGTFANIRRLSPTSINILGSFMKPGRPQYAIDYVSIDYQFAKGTSANFRRLPPTSINIPGSHTEPGSSNYVKGYISCDYQCRKGTSANIHQHLRFLYEARKSSVCNRLCFNC